MSEVPLTTFHDDIVTKIKNANERSMAQTKVRSLPGEMWEPVKGHPGYEVSSLGRVRLLKLIKYSGRQIGLLRPIYSSGTWNVCLHSQVYRLSHLVAEHFLSNSYKYRYVEFLNGNKEDFRALNLAWVKHPLNTVLSDEDVLVVRNLRKSGETIKTIAERFRANPALINQVTRGFLRSNIGGPIRREPNYDYAKHTQLTEDEVVAIRDLRAAGETGVALADRYGVARATISAIIRGKIRKNEAGPIQRLKYCGDHRGTKNPRAGALERVITISNLLREGKRDYEIAKLTGASKQTVYQIKTGKIWSHLNISLNTLDAILAQLREGVPLQSVITNLRLHPDTVVALQRHFNAEGASV